MAGGAFPLPLPLLRTRGLDPANSGRLPPVRELDAQERRREHHYSLRRKVFG